MSMMHLERNHFKENHDGLPKSIWNFNSPSDPHLWKAGSEMVRMVAGSSITHTNGETVPEVEVSQQAALNCMLAKINDLGSNIIMVEKNTPCKKEE